MDDRQEYSWFKCWNDIELYYGMFDTFEERNEFMQAVFDFGFRRIEYAGDNKQIKTAMIAIMRSIDSGATKKRGRPEIYKKPTFEDIVEIMHQICADNPDLPDDEESMQVCRDFFETYSATAWKNYKTPDEVKRMLKSKLIAAKDKRTTFTGKKTTAYTGRQNIDWEERERQLILAQKRDQEIESEDLT